MNILNKKLYNSSPSYSKTLRNLIQITGEDLNIKMVENHICGKGIRFKIDNLNDIKIDKFWDILITFRKDINEYDNKIRTLNKNSIITKNDSKIFSNLENHEANGFDEVINNYSKHKTSKQIFRRTPKQIFYEGYNESKLPKAEEQSIEKQAKDSSKEIKYIYIREFIHQILKLNWKSRTVSKIQEIYNTVLCFMVENGDANIYKREDLNILSQELCEKDSKLFKKLKSITDVTGEEIDIDIIKKEIYKKN